ncbi:MAG TPA: methyltransferase [Usitatibacter sp.]|nr:methyltransferase [Usitatibacter sp.]
MKTPAFPRRDPGEPAFWDLRYEAGFAPWDAGRVPARLRRFISEVPPARALVPGCGSAYEVRALAEAGWQVLGIDFSAEALAAARTVMGPFQDRLRQADFFGVLPEAPFDVVYERAFLCALPRRLWTAWAARMAQIVAPGGLLAGYFFIADSERGPPFPLRDAHELDGLLQRDFERIGDEAVADSIAVFAGHERWQAWRRHPA